MRPGDSPEPPAAGTILVYSVDLDPGVARIESLRVLLSPDELKRLARFRFAAHQRRFAVSRGSLRQLLGQILGEDPRQIRFEYGAHGKPMLSGTRLRFNVSDSADLALFALTLDAEIGVDVERIRPMPRAAKLARRFFSEAEAASILEAQGQRLDEVFFCSWTRKESWIKAVGGGLTIPLDRFEVSTRPEDPARLIRVEGEPDAAERWSMASFTPRPGFVAAVALEAPIVSLVQRTL